MTLFLILCTGVLIAAQWIHLAIREHGNPRLRSQGPMEPQVIGLGAGFVCMALLWLFGARAAFMDHPSAATSGAAFVAAVMAALGASLRVAAIERIGRGFSWGSTAPDTLITDGVYRYLKHPLIIGYVLEAFALGICAPRSLFVGIMTVLCGIALVLNAVAQVAKEEAMLRGRFPDDWPAYSKGKFL
jgi:protein-S-isoprenylcysteine O-methyltransferase Ste14